MGAGKKYFGLKEEVVNFLLCARGWNKCNICAAMYVYFVENVCVGGEGGEKI